MAKRRKVPQQTAFPWAPWVRRGGKKRLYAGKTSGYVDVEPLGGGQFRVHSCDENVLYIMQAHVVAGNQLPKRSYGRGCYSWELTSKQVTKLGKSAKEAFKSGAFVDRVHELTALVEREISRKARGIEGV